MCGNQKISKTVVKRMDKKDKVKKQKTTRIRNTGTRSYEGKKKKRTSVGREMRKRRGRKEKYGSL